MLDEHRGSCDFRDAGRHGDRAQGRPLARDANRGGDPNHQLPPDGMFSENFPGSLSCGGERVEGPSVLRGHVHENPPFREATEDAEQRPLRDGAGLLKICPDGSDREPCARRFLHEHADHRVLVRVVHILSVTAYDSAHRYLSLNVSLVRSGKPVALLLRTFKVLRAYHHSGFLVRFPQRRARDGFDVDDWSGPRPSSRPSRDPSYRGPIRIPRGRSAHPRREEANRGGSGSVQLLTVGWPFVIAPCQGGTKTDQGLRADGAVLENTLEGCSGGLRRQLSSDSKTRRPTRSVRVCDVGLFSSLRPHDATDDGDPVSARGEEAVVYLDYQVPTEVKFMAVADNPLRGITMLKEEKLQNALRYAEEHYGHTTACPPTV